MVDDCVVRVAGGEKHPSVAAEPLNFIGKRRENGSKTRSRTAAGMPVPVSLTASMR